MIIFIANMTRASKPLSIEGVQVWRAQRIFCAHIEIYRYRGSENGVREGLSCDLSDP